MEDGIHTAAQMESLLQLTFHLLHTIALPETRRPRAVTESHSLDERSRKEWLGSQGGSAAPPQLFLLGGSVSSQQA